MTDWSPEPARVRARVLLQRDRAHRTTPTRAAAGAAAEVIGVDDFYAYLPMHHYIFVPTRELSVQVDEAVRATHSAFDLDADEVEAVVYGGTGR